MFHHLKRSIHTSRKVYANRTVVYGWGQTQALPLTEGSLDRVISQPTCLNKLKDYALPEDSIVTHVATGWGHSLIGINEKEVYSFGLNQSGQLGRKDNNPIKFEHAIKYLACGREHSHVVTEKNSETQLYSFGNNMYGQLGLGKNKNTTPGSLVAEDKPRLIEGFKSIRHIVCGLDNTILATQDGSIYGMGWSADGQLGQGSEDRDIPSKLSLNANLKKLSSSTDFTLALTREGKLWTWGNSEYGQGLQGKIIDRILEPLEIQIQDDIVDMAAGGPFSVVLSSQGHVYTCGYGALGVGPETISALEPVQIQGLTNIKRVFATTDYAAALTESGQLYTWGLNGPSGRLGSANNEHAFLPKLVELKKKVIDVSLGTNHVLATCVE